MKNVNDHLMTLIDLSRLLTNAAGNLSVACLWLDAGG